MRTFRLSLTVTLACLVLGYPVAYALARARGWRGQLLLALVVAPFWISVLARSFTWMVLLQRQGVVNRALLALGLVTEPVPLVYNEIGVHVGMIHVLLPYMILSLYGAMRAIDPGLLRAAAGLGATEWQAFRRVWWPLSRAGVAAGSLLLFVVALGFFVTPALLGGGKVTTLAMLVEAHVSQTQDWPLAAALGLLLLIATLLALVPAQRALRLETFVGAGDADMPFRLLMGGAAGLSVALLLLPILALVPMSLSRTTWLAFPPDALTLEWYGRVLADREWREAAGTSLAVALSAALLAGLLGTPAGLALGRGRFAPGLRRVLRGVVLLPVMVPVVLVAIALYAAFAATGLGGTLTALVLAHAALGVPYVVLSVEAAARSLDPRLERAARGLGATSWQALRRVTLPLTRRGLLAGMLFAAIVSFDEVVVALFVGGPTTTTLPRKMWSTITQDEFNPLLTAVATLQMGVALGLLGVVAWLAAAGRRGDARPPDSGAGRAAAAGAAFGRPARVGGAPSRAGARLELRGLTKRFGAVTAVDELALTVEPGELLTLLGPSGCGKTTVLNLIAGFEAPDAGAVRIDTTDVAGLPPHRREVGMVFQDYALFPHLTVRENVAFPLRVRGVAGSEVRERVDAMLELVRLPGYGDRLPRQLSGGQQQRVALARALIFHPRVLLMDEPFGALDRALRETLRAELRDLQRALAITVVLVTHDQEEAMDLADRVAVMRDGRLQQVGPPRALYDRPANAFVAGFVGESNLLDGVVLSVEGGEAVVETAGGQRLRARGPRTPSRPRAGAPPPRCGGHRRGGQRRRRRPHGGPRGAGRPGADRAGPCPLGRRRAGHGHSTKPGGRPPASHGRSGDPPLAAERGPPPRPRVLNARPRDVAALRVDCYRGSVKTPSARPFRVTA